MSNMMPGDNSGAELKEHWPNCATQCKYSDHQFDFDKGVVLLMDGAAEMSWWKPGKSLAIVEVAQRRLAEGMNWIECPLGHRSHGCSCDRAAEAYADAYARADY